MGIFDDLAALLGGICRSGTVNLSAAVAGRAVELDGIDAVERGRPVSRDRMEARAEGLKESCVPTIGAARKRISAASRMTVAETTIARRS